MMTNPLPATLKSTDLAVLWEDLSQGIAQVFKNESISKMRYMEMYRYGRKSGISLSFLSLFSNDVILFLNLLYSLAMFTITAPRSTLQRSTAGPSCKGRLQFDRPTERLVAILVPTTSSQTAGPSSLVLSSTNVLVNFSKSTLTNF